MANVAFDASANAGAQTNVGSATFNVTIAANTNRYLLVTVQSDAGAEVATSITAGGTPLASLGTVGANGNVTASIWGLAAPSTGVVSVVVNVSTVLDWTATAASLRQSPISETRMSRWFGTGNSQSPQVGYR